MFMCDKCGQCCRNLRYSSIYSDLDRGDGICKYLKNNLCSIYETRPLKCRIDDSYDIYFKDIMKKEDYYKLNYMVCEKLKQKKE